MSAAKSALDVDVDLEGNVATVDLFEDDECRLWEDENGWRGFVREDGRYYWVDTRHDDDWSKVLVGEGAVQTTIGYALAGEPVALAAGRAVAP